MFLRFRQDRRRSGGMAALLFIMWGITEVHAGVSYDPARTWYTLTTPHFRVHYHDGETSLARQAAAVAESVHARLAPRFRWTPAEPTDVVITDSFDLSNGYAEFFPSDRMTLFVAAPDSINSLEDHAGWLETLITHEYTHILHLDKARGAPKILRYLFGRHVLLFPNAYQPSWLIEGLATYQETDHARGIGRGQSSYFNMLMRLEVEQGIKPLQQINQPIATWPMGTVPYLYGAHFYNFISDRFGDEKIQRLVDNYSDNIIPFMINSNSRKSLGKSLKDLWPEFETYLQDKYQPVRQDIHARGVVAGERLTQHGYFSGPVRALADGRIFYVRDDAASKAAIMLWRAGAQAPEKLTDVHSTASFDVHPQAGILLVQPEVYRNANLYKDLYRINLKRASIKRLSRGARFRSAAWSPDAVRIAAVHNSLDRNSLQLLTRQGKLLETVWTGEPGEVVADLAWSPRGDSLVAALWRPGSGWNLEQFLLDERRWLALTQDQVIQAQPRFTPDANGVLFTSEQGGVYNLRHLDLASGQVTTLSNVEGGAFYPSQAQVGGPIYYTGYHAGGFDIYRLDNPLSVPTPALVKQALPASPPSINLVEMPSQSYSPWVGLRPRWWFPHVAIEEGRAEVGALTSAWDPLRRHIYLADMAYDFDNRWFVGALDYIYDRWYPILKLHASRYNELEHNNDYEALRVRRFDRYAAALVFPLISYDSAWALHVAALQERESDRILMTGVTPLPDTEDNLLGAALVYDSTVRHARSISRSDGRQVWLVSENSDALGDSDFSGEVYSLDWREFLGLGGEHVIAMRVAGGWGTNNPRPFRLGRNPSAPLTPGFLDGASYDSPFNQRRYALRGYPTGLPSLTGRRMAVASLEWRFPLMRVERGFMAPPLGLHQVFGSAFVDTGSAWDNGDKPGPYLTGAGVEASADVILFYNFGLNLRLGYAHGFNQGGEEQFYLRAGAAF